MHLLRDEEKVFKSAITSSCRREESTEKNHVQLFQRHEFWWASTWIVDDGGGGDGVLIQIFFRLSANDTYRHIFHFFIRGSFWDASCQTDTNRETHTHARTSICARFASDVRCAMRSISLIPRLSKCETNLSLFIYANRCCVVHLKVVQQNASKANRQHFEIIENRYSTMHTNISSEREYPEQMPRDNTVSTSDVSHEMEKKNIYSFLVLNSKIQPHFNRVKQIRETIVSTFLLLHQQNKALSHRHNTHTRKRRPNGICKNKCTHSARHDTNTTGKWNWKKKEFFCWHFVRTILQF